MSEDKEAIANSSQESTQEILKKILKKIHENGEGRSVYDLGNPALIAGTFDYLRLESQINDLLGKTADGRQNCGALIKLLTMQLLNVPHQMLSDTSLFMESIPSEVILGNGNGNGNEIKPEQACRADIAKLLDAISIFGTEELFDSLSRQVFDRLGIEPQEAQIESSGFYYSDYESEYDSSQLILNQRCGRENTELNHASDIVLVDSLSRIPIGIIKSDDSAGEKRSEFDKASSCLPELRKKFPKLQSVSRKRLPAKGSWRCCQRPEITVDSMYLEDSSRIEVLLFLMDTALLVYAADTQRVLGVVDLVGDVVQLALDGLVEQQIARTAKHRQHEQNNQDACQLPISIRRAFLRHSIHLPKDADASIKIMKNILLIYIKFITKSQLFFNKNWPFFKRKGQIVT